MINIPYDILKIHVGAYRVLIFKESKHDVLCPWTCLRASTDHNHLGRWSLSHFRDSTFNSNSGSVLESATKPLPRWSPWLQRPRRSSAIVSLGRILIDGSLRSCALGESPQWFFSRRWILYLPGFSRSKKYRLLSPDSLFVSDTQRH